MKNHSAQSRALDQAVLHRLTVWTLISYLEKGRIESPEPPDLLDHFAGHDRENTKPWENNITATAYSGSCISVDHVPALALALALGRSKDPYDFSSTRR